MCVSLCVPMCVCMPFCIRIYIYTQMQTYINIDAYARIYVHTRMQYNLNGVEGLSEHSVIKFCRTTGVYCLQRNKVQRAKNGA
jgi:hypothetical protein